MLESALHGEQRLRDLHITRLHDPSGIDKLYDKLKGTPEERLQKKVVRRGARWLGEGIMKESSSYGAK